MKICRSYVPFLVLLFTAVLIFFSQNIWAQCTPQVRKYATRQQDLSIALLGLGGSVSNGSLAVDGDPKTASNLSFLLGALGLTYAEQVIDFNPSSSSTGSYAALIPANTPITLKIALPSSILSVLGGIEIQGIKDLQRTGTGTIFNPYVWNYNSVGSIFSGNSLNLLGLLNGAGEVEITVTPNADYQGIRVRLSSALGLSASAKLYDAYILENSASSINCGSPLDVLSGVRAGTVVGGIANATGSVTDPLYAIDSDPNSFALMSTGVQVLSQVYETAVFNTPSVAGDSVKIVLQDPGGTLLDLNLLTGFTIQPYLKNATAGSPFLSSDIFLSLKLLPSSGNKYELTLPITSSYDRVEISMGGVAGALSGLKIYDVKRIIPRPPVLIDNANVSSKSICIGSSAILTINTPQACTDYRWYKVASGGSAVQTGTSYSPALADLVTGPNIFYVEAQRQGCTESISTRTSVTITVNALPIAPTVSGTSTCSGSPASLTVTSPDANLTYKWYTASSGGLLVNTGATFITPPISTATDYYVEVTNNSTTCISSTRTKVSVSIKSLPIVSAIIGSTNLCVGVGLTYTNSSLDPGVWSTSDPSTVTIDANGFAKGISVGTATITYTVTNAISGCTNSKSVTVTVFSLPTITLNPTPAICIGTTNASLPYSGVSSGSLDYSIVWNDSSFTNINNINLPTSPISLNIPSTASPGDYTGTFILRNSNSGCFSSYLISIKINPKPPPPTVSIQ